MSGAPGLPRRTWRTVAELVEGTRGLLVVAVLLTLGQALLLLPVALLVRHVFDVDVPRNDEAAILVRGLLVAGCYTASTALSAVGRGYAARATKVALGGTRRRLVSQLERLPLSWHDRQAAGRLHAVVVQDCERVDRMLNSLMSQVLPAITALAALGVVALVLDAVLFAVLAVFVPVMVLVARRFSKTFRYRLSRWHAVAETFSEHTHVMLGGLATLRAAGAERRDRDRFEGEIDAFTEAGYRAAVAGARYQAAQSAVGAVAGVCVLVAGSLLVARGALSFGGLLAFYAVVALLLRQLSAALAGAPILLEGAVAAGRVAELAAAREPGAYAGTGRLAFAGAIELDRVSFSYDGDAWALEDVSLRLGAGEHLSVIGPNGAGKTTLMALMLGLYRPQHGEVRADGVPLAELDLTELRQQVGVIMQDAELFAGTIRENLTLTDPSADDDAIDAALRAADAGFVAALPRGLDTRLGDDGAGLSGGQHQRVAIARAVLSRPQLMLLDEPTAHLSPAASAAVVANLTQLPWRPTVLVITHDASVAAVADRWLRLRDGRLSPGWGELFSRPPEGLRP